jgi:hypothetical protein
VALTTLHKTESYVNRLVQLLIDDPTTLAELQHKLPAVQSGQAPMLNDLMAYKDAMHTSDL